MLSINYVKKLAGKDYVEGACLSSDVKPTARLATGSMLVEVDSGKLFLYDEQSERWEEFA